MTANLFFTGKQLRLVNYIKWLIAFCFIIRLLLFFMPFVNVEIADSHIFNQVNFVLLTAAVWGGYFLVRKKWLPFWVITVFAFVELFFKKDIAVSLDYYLSYVLNKNTGTINEWVDRFFVIGYFVLIPLLYGKAEAMKGRKQWLLTFLVGITAIVTTDNANLGLLERMDVTGSWQEKLYAFILAVLYTIKDIAFLLAFFHILFRIKNRQHLLQLPPSIMMIRKQFLPSFFVAYSVFVFSVLTLIYSILKMSFAFFFNPNLLVFLEGACMALPVLVSAFFIGNTIERRNDVTGSYYGFFAFISWIPVINIAGYVTMAFVETKQWLKAREYDCSGKQRLIHILLSCLLIWGLYAWLYNDKDFTDALYYVLLYSLATVVLAYKKKAVLLIAILASVGYIFKNVWDSSTYYDESIWKLLGEKFDLETLFLVVFYSLIHFSVFFIVHKALYRKKEQEEVLQPVLD